MGFHECKRCWGRGFHNKPDAKWWEFFYWKWCMMTCEVCGGDGHMKRPDDLPVRSTPPPPPPKPEIEHWGNTSDIRHFIPTSHAGAHENHKSRFDRMRFLEKRLEDEIRLRESIFRTLYEWHRVATYLPPGKSGQRMWYVTRGDVEHLEKWAADLSELSNTVRINFPQTLERKV